MRAGSSEWLDGSADLITTLLTNDSTLRRVWEASVYPTHALYVGGSWVDENDFDEDDEWVIQGPVSQRDAFNRLGAEASFTPYTPLAIECRLEG
ncbi:hypothetical protein [Haladaptatus sp. YSMS36]|uniref:hypothetical protein n=1 Tax=Haladaptatus sp. YSMS36 TaxID=3033384 RepID=UPI0023E8EF5C|nr:hypothetical protein [Haladaptatus sp. YSMS36]